MGTRTIRLLFQSTFHFRLDPRAPRGHTKYPGPVHKMNLVLVESLRQSDYYFEAPSRLLLFQLLKAMLPSLQTARYDLVLAATSRWVRVSYKTERLAKRFLNNAGKRAELSNRVWQRLEESENRTPGQDRRTATAPVVLSEHTPDPIRI